MWGILTGVFFGSRALKISKNIHGPAGMAGKTVGFYFEGVYENALVYINE